GNVVARDWYIELPDAVCQIVDEADFGIFCRGLSRLTTYRPLIAALVERWWDTTNSFHFSVAGDMTMTPYDFSMLTGIGVGGDPIPFDTDMDEWDTAQLYLLGTQPPLARAGFVRYSWFESHFRIQPALAEEAQMTPEEVDQYARGFIMFLFGTTLFADPANTVPLCLLSALVDVRRICCYDWGGSSLATLYVILISILQLWVYAYFPRLAPVPVVEIPLGVPFSHRFDVRCVRRPRESFSFFCRYFDTITSAEITWQPWAPLPAEVRDHYEGAYETARLRILLEGPVCRAWYLGERFLRQTLGLPEQIVPGPPPTHMRDTEEFSLEHMREYTTGWGVEHHRGEGDYAEYVRTYIMRPLSGGHRAERERPAAPVARVGAGAGGGASRRAGVRSRGGVQRGRGASWLALPASLTYRGQGGVTYQIPFAPPPADHEILMHLILLQASSEYTRQSLELNASMMGMLQRTFDLLALYSIP
ncbi:Protein MAINTENANCE OF MERISTEMS, partial [Camellia lanceoleosa]